MSHISNYNQLLAEGNLGSENVDFYNGQGQLSSNSVALNTLVFTDQDNFQHFNTYGSKANYYERNRRINGAYGPVYDGECNWLNPVNHFNLNSEDKFYYLQDFAGTGQFSHLFIEGLTLISRHRPAVYYQFYNSTFFDDPNSYYRMDVLGSMYPYTHGNVKADIIIQQFSNYRASDKLYLSYQQAFGHPYHSEYQIRVPITCILLNDKLYEPSAPPPVDDPGEDPLNPIINPFNPPVTPLDPPQEGEPLTDPYSNFGGDTTDTGPTPNIDIPINPYFDRSNPRYVQQYFPTIDGWRRWFRWY
jgi:hypothetical protein